MAVIVGIVCAIFAALMIGLSVRANRRFKNETNLPLQWLISKSQPLSKTVVRSGPRVFVLSFVPVLSICVFLLIVVGASTLTPRPGQEGMLLPAVLFIGGAFVAVQLLLLRLIEKTLRPD